MAGYGDNETNLVEDEYDDLDDFIVGSDDEGDNVAEDEVEEELPEAEEEEVEEEYEEEEEEEPPVGTQEILSFREQLKAKLRKQHQSNGADNGNPSCSSSDQPPVRSRFGTFFGPSTPVLAPRLIEAGCSSIMKENQNLPSRKHAALSSASEMQPSASAPEQKPKIVPQVKRKVDTLRENRDYSNLFSDDADAPPPTEERAESKPVMATKSDVEAHRMKPIQSAATNKKVPTNHPARPSKDHGSIQSRVQNKVVSQVKKEPLPNGRKPIAAARNGSRPPNGTTKARPGLQPSSNGQNPQRSMQSKSPQTLPAAQRQQQRPPKPQGQRQQNHIPSSPQVRRMNSSVQGQQPAHKGSALPRDRTKLGQKQLAPSSRPKPSPISAVYSDPAKKKGVVKRKLSDAEKVRQMVRDVLNYDPGKYSGKDDDDSDMEAGYASIQMEERRSAKIARAEDEEQYRLIQQEEQSERAKKKQQRTES